ncbi:MAG: S-layer homology domain-containing protein [Clostridia bacterium]|nr:S-layer homology domain-containing protein [Clostridia bacterium]
MKKSIFTVFLALLLCALTAVSVSAAELTFEDVTEDKWYYADVLTAVEAGLVNGRSETAFCPEENLTAAEAVKLAACMRQFVTEGKVTLENGDPWYQTYADYARENGIIDEDPVWNEPMTRADYMGIFARALPDENLAPINEIPEGSLPDVPADHFHAAGIYKLARAGVVQGDNDRNVKPDSLVRRCEVAAILTRMVFPETRITFEAPAQQQAQKEIYPNSYVGLWSDPQFGRATVKILPSAEEGKYEITIVWGDSASSSGEWSMKASFDPGTGKMAYENGTMALVTYDETGKAVSSEERWNDAAGYFLFDADGKLTWDDSREERSREFSLERVVLPASSAPTAEELTESFFQVIGSIAPGTAGSSLRQAKAAADVMDFAAKRQIWTADNEALRANILAAWEAMSKDEQSAFDESFISVLSFMRDALADWETNKPVFEDAGVLELMEALRADPSAKLSWDALTGNTLTMGNSAGE